mmetsp:Transcript_4502/g.7521  ORF Transcript_4502/g.7521 Transcript_4502/m.7521 type:complete len:115 (-) Transcript_4502:252-596(-)
MSARIPHRIKTWKDISKRFRKPPENRFMQPFSSSFPYDVNARPYYNEGVPVVGGERMRFLRNTRQKMNARWTIEYYFPAAKSVIVFMGAFIAYDQFVRGAHTTMWGLPRHYDAI